jgi:hypothetical protein
METNLGTRGESPLAIATGDSNLRSGIVAKLVVVSVLLAACAQVPRESVELSTAVGRDAAVAHESHRNLAQTLFSRIKRDVNRFVDDVYAPYQIQFVLDRQKKRQAARDPANLFSILEIAAQRAQDTQAQRDALAVMQVIVEEVHVDIEEYRRLRMTPILQQEREVMAAIDRVYEQIKEGNAVVTAHLASVVRVHEVQDDLLRKANLDGLREKVGVSLSNASIRIAEFVDKANSVEGSIDTASAQVNKLTTQLDKLIKGD